MPATRQRVAMKVALASVGRMAQCSVVPVNVQFSMRTAGTATPPRKPFSVRRSLPTATVAAQRVEVALGVAQVADRPDDPPALHEERPVAGHAGDDRQLRVDRVRVVEARDEEAAVQPADQLVPRRVAGLHDHVERERAVRVRGRQAVAGRLDAVTRCGLDVVHDVAAGAALDELDPLLGQALVVERHRQARRIHAVVADRHEVAADPLARLEERALLLDRERAEAEVAEHVEQVDDRVFLEDHGIVAVLDRDRVGAGPGLLGGLAADRGRVDRRRVHRGCLGVAAARRSGPIDTVIRCAVVREPATRTPLELATAVASVPVENEP